MTKDAIDETSSVSRQRSWGKRLFDRIARRAPAAEFDPLSAFAPERRASAIGGSAPFAPRGDRPSGTTPSTSRGRPAFALRSVGWASVIAAALILGAMGWVRRDTQTARASTPARPGHVSVRTEPAGAEVSIDGQVRGATPLDLSLEAGSHSMTVRSGGQQRVVPLAIGPGAEVSQYFDLKPAEAVGTAGRLLITTDPPRARVSVDGVLRGTSPVTIDDLAIGDHNVVVTNDVGTADRSVTIQAGTTTSVVFSLPTTTAAVGGFLTVAAPFSLDIVEGRDVIGAGGSAKIMLLAGRHTLIFANRALEFEEARSVQIAAGKTTALRIDAPRVPVAINARPWADVFVDDTNVGQTPIANVAIAIGTHQVVFRHPQLGERRQTLVVTSNGPNRAAADLTK